MPSCWQSRKVLAKQFRQKFWRVIILSDAPQTSKSGIDSWDSAETVSRFNDRKKKIKMLTKNKEKCYGHISSTLRRCCKELITLSRNLIKNNMQVFNGKAKVWNQNIQNISKCINVCLKDLAQHSPDVVKRIQIKDQPGRENRASCPGERIEIGSPGPK